LAFLAFTAESQRAQRNAEERGGERTKEERKVQARAGKGKRRKSRKTRD
jgi:hypothetical protein